MEFTFYDLFCHVCSIESILVVTILWPVNNHIQKGYACGLLKQVGLPRLTCRNALLHYFVTNEHR